MFQLILKTALNFISIMTLIKPYLHKNIIPQSQTKFNILLISIFAIITLLGILNHAMWRDEINGWLIARDSVSLSQFIQNIQYEGHPILWYFCLWILNQLTSNPIAMQIFHWFIAVGCFSLFILFSPFTKQQKILFIFGYLPLYEYSLISRNYSIGIFCIFLFCTCFFIRHKTYIPLAIILVIMANTNAYCLLLSMALALTLAFEYIFQSYLAYETKANINNIILAIIIFSIGILLSILMLIPPQDSTLQGGASQWILEFDWNRLNQTITRIWRSYILILIPSDSKPFDLVLFAILSLGLFGFCITMLIRKPVVLFFYIIASLQFLLFTYIKFLGSQRHYGHLYIILISSLWLSNYYKSSNLFIKYLNQLPHKLKHIWLNWFRFVNHYKTIFIMIILWLQLIAGGVAFGRDLLTPYSASRATANFIKENNLFTNIIVGSEDFTVSPISGYLNQKIYYPENQKLGSYVLFSDQRKLVEDREILAQISQLITPE
ncbi:hypothetical protein, partial [Aphanothece sacrum]|uniref:hypothetical protein n=1 Tax=Aphanothece sacrum TaxID=1122 RepID=UPI0011CFE23D